MAKKNSTESSNRNSKASKVEASLAAAEAKKSSKKRTRKAEMAEERKQHENIFGEKFARDRVAKEVSCLINDILFEDIGKPRRAFSDPSCNDAVTNALLLIQEGNKELGQLWCDQDEAVEKIVTGLKKFGKRAELRQFSKHIAHVQEQLATLDAPVARSEGWSQEAIEATDLDGLPERLAFGWKRVVDDLRGALNHRGIRTAMTVKLGGVLHPTSVASDVVFEVRMHRKAAPNRWYPEVEGAHRNQREWKVGNLYPTVDVSGLPASGVDKDDIDPKGKPEAVWEACEGASPYAYWRKIPGVKWESQASVLRQIDRPRSFLRIDNKAFAIKKIEVRREAEAAE